VLIFCQFNEDNWKLICLDQSNTKRHIKPIFYGSDTHTYGLTLLLLNWFTVLYQSSTASAQYVGSHRLVGGENLPTDAVFWATLNLSETQGTEYRSVFFKQALLVYVLRLANRCAACCNFNRTVWQFQYLADPSIFPTELTVQLVNYNIPRLPWGML